MHNDGTGVSGADPQVKPAIADTDWVAPPVVMGKVTPTADAAKRSVRIPDRLLLVIAAAAIAGGSVYIWQHGRVTELDAKVSNLQQQVTSLQAHINESPGAAPKDSGTVSTGGSTTTAGMEGGNVQAALQYGQQAGKPSLNLGNGTITITSALYAVYFGNSAYNGEGAILDLTVSNTTSRVQSYDLSGLTLQLPNGTIVTSGELYIGDTPKPPIVTVAPSGSTEEIIGFSPLNPNATPGTGYLRYMSGSTVVSEAALTFRAPLN